jgi:hypothetical protein
MAIDKIIKLNLNDRKGIAFEKEGHVIEVKSYIQIPSAKGNKPNGLYSKFTEKEGAIGLMVMERVDNKLNKYSKVYNENSLEKKSQAAKLYKCIQESFLEK